MGCIAQPMEELDTGSNGNLPSITGGAERRRQDGMECPKFLSTHVNNELNGLAVCIANKISTQRPATISPHRTTTHQEGWICPSLHKTASKLLCVSFLGPSPMYSTQLLRVVCHKAHCYHELTYKTGTRPAIFPSLPGLFFFT